MPLGRDIDELLTGYIDGQLTSDELCWTEAVLQQDPSLAVRLSELRDLSRDLKVLGQGAASGLPDDFANRVLVRCGEVSSGQRVAEMVDDFVEEPSLQGDPHLEGDLLLPERSTQWAPHHGRWLGSYRRVAAVFAVLAGMIAMAVWLPQYWRQVDSVHPLVDNTYSTGATQLDSVTNEAGGPGSQDLVASSAESDSDNDPFDAPAFPNDNSSIASTDVDAIDLDSLSGALGLEVRDSADSQNGAGSHRHSEQLASQRPSGSQINYILVLDVEITQQAAQHNLLGSLLAKYGIDLSIGVPFNSEIEKAVNRMRYSVPENRRTKPAELLLVRAPVAILDAAVSELEAEVELVPGYRYDLAFQTPTVSLSQVILDSLGSQVAANDPLAIPLVTDLDSASAVRLESIPNQGTLVSSNRRRERFDSAPDGNVVAGDLSYLLILIRQQ